MQIKTQAKISSDITTGAGKPPLRVLNAATLSQVAGGGPNGGWAIAASGIAPAAPGAAAAGPNGGWAAIAAGPNGGW